jgi:type II secretory pathway component GspD/PulD (secretin)
LKRFLRMGFAICLSFITMAFFVSPSLAQTEVEDTNLSPTMKEGLTKTVTLDADDAFLPAILTILANKSGFNIVTGPGVNKQERISVHIKDTPIEEAINLVVRAAGLSYEIIGNSFLVAEPEALEQEVGLTAHVYDLQYAKGTEVKELLTDLTENVQVDTSGNRILVLSSPKVASEISDIIKRIDIPPMQIMLEARLIEVATEDLDEYGIDWERLSHLTTILAESPLNEDGSSRAPTEVDFGGNLPELDKLPERYKFEKIEGWDNVGLFSRQLNAFDITLDFLVKRNKAKVLAHSKITTVNNRKASILIGEILKWAEVSERNAIIETEEVGIRLQITPTINSGGYITTAVEPEVSSITELIQGKYPRKKIRTANTTVLVKDGQKIFIGGLLSVDDTNLEYKMPLLSEIPLIGRLFTHTEYTTRKTDLIIEITPRIIKSVTDYSDAGNYSSDGYQIIGPGETTDFKAIEPEIEQFNKDAGNMKEELKSFQDRVVTPKSEKEK